jgi:hypothetical protein
LRGEPLRARGFFAGACSGCWASSAMTSTSGSGANPSSSTEANVAVLADDDLGLEPETTTEPAAVEDDGFAPEPEVEVIADEAQQPEQAPAKKPRARKGSPLKVVDEQVAESAVSDETTELIELGRAIKTLLDYVAKASNTGKTVNVQVV